jgi:hypothetical protein
MLAAARAREDLQVREPFAHQHRGARRGIRIPIASTRNCALAAWRPAAGPARGITVVDLAAVCGARSPRVSGCCRAR